MPRLLNSSVSPGRSGPGVFAPLNLRETGALTASQVLKSATERSFAAKDQARAKLTGALVQQGEAKAAASRSLAGSGRILAEAGEQLRRQAQDRRARTIASNAGVQAMEGIARAVDEETANADPTGAAIVANVDRRIGEHRAFLNATIEADNYKAAAEEDFEIHAAQGLLRARRAQTALQRNWERTSHDNRLAKLGKLAVRGGAARDPADQVVKIGIGYADIDMMVADGLFSPAEGEAKKAAFRNTVAKQTIDADLATNPRLAAARLANGDYSHLFAGDAEFEAAGARIAAGVGRQQQAATQAARAAAAHQAATQFAAASAAVDAGELGPEGLAALAEAGKLSAADSANLAQRATARAERAVAQATAIDTTSERLASGGFDPADPAHRGDAEAWAEAAIATARAAAAAPSGGSAFDGTLVAVPQRLGFTPHAVRQPIAELLISDQPADKARAAGVLAAIAEDAPDALDMLSPDEVVFAAVYQATGSADQEVKLAFAENAAKTVIDGNAPGAAKFVRMLGKGALDEAAIEAFAHVIQGGSGDGTLLGGADVDPLLGDDFDQETLARLLSDELGVDVPRRADGSVEVASLVKVVEIATRIARALGALGKRGGDLSKRHPRGPRPRIPEEDDGAQTDKGAQQSETGSAAAAKIEPPELTSEELRALPDDHPTFWRQQETGRPFLANANGGPDLGQAFRATKDERQAFQIEDEILGIRLPKSEIRHVDSPAHRAAARGVGYRDGLHLALDVVANWTEMRVNPEGGYFLVRPNGLSKTITVEISRDPNGGDFWIITRAGPRRPSALGELVGAREPTPGVDVGNPHSQHPDLP